MVEVGPLLQCRGLGLASHPGTSPFSSLNEASPAFPGLPSCVLGHSARQPLSPGFMAMQNSSTRCAPLVPGGEREQSPDRSQGFWPQLCHQLTPRPCASLCLSGSSLLHVEKQRVLLPTLSSLP